MAKISNPTKEARAIIHDESHTDHVGSSKIIVTFVLGTIIVSNVIMAAFTVRVGVLMVFVCGVVFTSWNLDVLVNKQDFNHGRKQIINSDIDDHLTTSNGDKKENVISGGNLQSINLTNVEPGQRMVISDKVPGYVGDPIYPFEEENTGEESENDDDGSRSDHDNVITNNSSHQDIKTFFTAVQTTFKDVQILPNRSIPTLEFLDACLNAVQILKNMRRAIFDRVEADVQGNIKKIRDNYNSHPDESYTLQSMILHDVEELEILNNDPDYYATSTILALKWLVRAFRFISRFMKYIIEGRDQIQSANKAYDETLKMHHGFIARAIFKTAFLTLSTRRDFLKEFALNEADFARPDFEEKVIADSRDYFIALDERLEIIERFFLQHDIEL
ncbi:pleckstrin homology domain-containing family A member 8-like [Lytechinus variegatus]|uniref:pleckstrin homology domain-containing family A member 8-like n=1 Tax=Lytechinus variegatus TaxID=7654 RepID=UPI001BB15947|nr:pleckstrin homology domain-containing family A member 8-like [Lytechinus variegatus]XP_041482715.1 pleckstrin homology domain-containing family A member 8-like [Lytechinus variegatus]